MRCKHRHGVIARHNNIRNIIARFVINPDGLQRLLGNAAAFTRTLDYHPAGILAQPRATEPGVMPGKPTAHDSAGGNPFHQQVIYGTLRLYRRNAYYAKPVPLRKKYKLRPHLNEADTGNTDWEFYA